MQHCEKCGKLLNPKSRFCDYCGAKVNACPNCGKKHDPDATICNQCGTKLSTDDKFNDIIIKPNNQYQFKLEQEPEQELKHSKKDAIISFVFSLVILQLSFLCIIPLFCFFILILNVIFLAEATIKRKNYLSENKRVEFALTKASRICSIIGLILTIVLSVLGFIIFYLI